MIRLRLAKLLSNWCSKRIALVSFKRHVQCTTNEKNEIKESKVEENSSHQQMMEFDLVQRRSSYGRYKVLWIFIWNWWANAWPFWTCIRKYVFISVTYHWITEATFETPMHVHIQWIHAKYTGKNKCFRQTTNINWITFLKNVILCSARHLVLPTNYNIVHIIQWQKRRMKRENRFFLFSFRKAPSYSISMAWAPISLSLIRSIVSGNNRV